MTERHKNMAGLDRANLKRQRLETDDDIYVIKKGQVRTRWLLYICQSVSQCRHNIYDRVMCGRPGKP